MALLFFLQSICFFAPVFGSQLDTALLAEQSHLAAPVSPLFLMNQVIDLVNNNQNKTCTHNSFETVDVSCMTAQKFFYDYKKQDAKDRHKLMEQVLAYINQCEQKRFEKCYTKLTPVIEQEALESLWQNWTQDNKLRMSTAAVG